ncbi:hypothetical protein COMA2_240001 [Candidatus Nitrospira nitrificans]|uniref:Uncharacterized protein n=1 Tax=Candidatus Nitrospira nitrificans TaxID=1742973 RepID=A0A0S4LG71_9BACT|nr:hypothetical protein COMA2_240001 [Candidatus Nitrospira nitrificans]
MVLWQDPDAHVPGQCALGEGKNPSGVNPVRTRCLSDEVLTYTPRTFPHRSFSSSPP